MSTTTSRCKLCRAEMTQRRLDPIDGEAHDVKMRIEGMPALQCEAGHRRFVTPDFAIKMMEALLADDKLIEAEIATEKGLFRKHYCCPGCGEAIEGAKTQRLTSRRPVAVKGQEPFDVAIDVPKYRCPKCGRESVEPQKILVNDLMKASVEAFKSANITPG